MQREQSAEPSDRQQRAELEQLQAELADARAALARGGDPQPGELQQLEAELTEATALAEAARAEVARLEADLAEHEQTAQTLKRQLEEEKVQSLGRSRRDRYVDWAPPGTVREIEPIGDLDDLSPSQLIGVVLGLLLLLGFLWLIH